MSTLESYSIESPFGKTEECAKFTIDDVTVPFVLHDILRMDQQYVLSFWIKGDAEGTLITYDKANSVTTEWTRHVVIFTAGRPHLNLLFAVAGTYYIYHPQLEIGNKATDWTPSPEDVDEGIKDAKNDASNAQSTADSAASRVSDVEATLLILQECIANLVTDGVSGSLMVQTENGWVFNMGPTLESLNEASENIDELMKDYSDQQSILNKLQQSIDDNPLTSENVEIGVFEDEPCIALSESDSEYRMLITNKRIVFIYGGKFNDDGILENYTPLTQINTAGVTTDNITVNNEIKQGGFAWVIHGSGNLGLVWKGA